jgi:trimeric autotransporter adhesin
LAFIINTDLNFEIRNPENNMKLKFYFSLAFLICLLSIYHTLTGQVSLGISTYNQDFNSLSNGTDNIPVATPALPDGWAFLETGTSANALYRPHNGSGNSGDTYSFGTTGNTERALGQIRSSSVISTLGGNFQNNTSTTISSLTITYAGEQWRLGAIGRNDKMDFQYSLDATSLSTGTWTDVNDLDFIAPVSAGTTGVLDGNAAANRVTVTFTLSGLNIANASSFWIRWNDADATGSDDGLAIDDFSISAADATSPTFLSGYPKTSNITTAGFNVIANLSETGKTYFIILPNNATSPTATQVKNGQDASGSSLASNLFGTINVATANSDYSATIIGLTDNTDYDVYVDESNW